MFDNILSENQKELLPFIESFKKEFYLVGGTAIALQIGHRESIDFDLFKFSTINTSKITQRLKDFNLTYA
jgi:Nucleotidyl transferase AbiEii toxin, Type IV TA system